VEITLNDEKTSIWGLTESDIFLTYTNPGPIELNWDILTLSQQVALKSAILQEQVFCDSKIPEIEENTQIEEKAAGAEVAASPFCSGRQPTDSPNTKTVAPDIASFEQQKEIANKQLEKDAKGLLRKHAGTIKTSLEKATVEHMGLLVAMKRIEQKKKRSRPKIIKLINDTLTRVQNEAAQAIAENISKNAMPQRGYVDPLKTPKGIELTEDIETEDTVTFNPSTGKITKNQEAIVN